MLRITLQSDQVDLPENTVTLRMILFPVVLPAAETAEQLRWEACAVLQEEKEQRDALAELAAREVRQEVLERGTRSQAAEMVGMVHPHLALPTVAAVAAEIIRSMMTEMIVTAIAVPEALVEEELEDITRAAAVNPPQLAEQTPAAVAEAAGYAKMGLMDPEATAQQEAPALSSLSGKMEVLWR